MLPTRPQWPEWCIDFLVCLSVCLSVFMITSYTINFQNNAQVQINAWSQAQCLKFITLIFVFQKNAWFNLTPGLMSFEKINAWAIF